jgi:hypothetical protein
VVSRGGSDVGAGAVGTGAVGTGAVGTGGATVGAGASDCAGSALGVGDGPALGPAGRVSRINRPKATSATTAAPRKTASRALDPVALWLPAKVQRARRGHVPEQCR